MKKTSIIILALALLASCTEVSKKTEIETEVKTEKTSNEKEETINKPEEKLQPEETAVENDHRFDNLSTETTASDCYIVSHFTDKDITYITVDFVSYKLNEDSKNTDYEIYDLVNVIKTLRTFQVNEEYMNCGRDKKVSISELIKMYQKDPKLVFSIETVDGITTELYIDTCSG